MEGLGGGTLHNVHLEWDRLWQEGVSEKESKNMWELASGDVCSRHTELNVHFILGYMCRSNGSKQEADDDLGNQSMIVFVLEISPGQRYGGR